MSLIPKGDRRGWVIVWDAGDYNGAPMAGEQRTHRYSLINPITKVREDHCFTLPPDLGDLFCAGHAWTAEGDLLVVGGTLCHNPSSTNCMDPGYGGSTLAYLWKPPSTADGIPLQGEWLAITNSTGQESWLDEERWYPSVTVLNPSPLDGIDRIMVSGGTHHQSAVNSYQVWQPPPPSGPAAAFGGLWQPAPGSGNTFAGSSNSFLGDYPRQHLLSAPLNTSQRGRVAMVGSPAISDRVSHYTAPGIWLPGSQAAWAMTTPRVYGSSVLLPFHAGNRDTWDRILHLGGNDQGSPQTILDSIEWTNAAPPSPALLGWQEWTSDPLHTERWFLNTVLLPDSRVFVVGGGSGTTFGCSTDPALTPEVIDAAQPAGSRIRELWPSTIVRDYHSTAVLLPDGRILTGGGESRRTGAQSDCEDPNPANVVAPADYQIFDPDYVVCGGGDRPVSDR